MSFLKHKTQQKNLTRDPHGGSVSLSQERETALRTCQPALTPVVTFDNRCVIRAHSFCLMQRVTARGITSVSSGWTWPVNYIIVGNECKKSWKTVRNRDHLVSSTVTNTDTRMLTSWKDLDNSSSVNDWRADICLLCDRRTKAYKNLQLRMKKKRFCHHWWSALTNPLSLSYFQFPMMPLDASEWIIDWKNYRCLSNSSG